ncbi:oxidoreductase [Marinoscillum pacificum]|uniref:oxidoreductase n=1 Tax=Marinoscillum pacificum TaxID=392723 RepID=UPI0021575D3A|nr:oxidoreductase [Marinoscillum pacificum]
MTYSFQSLESQSDRTAVVTGANVGLGYETAKALASKDLTVVLACRNLDKANKAIERIKKSYPAAKLDALALDLCSNQSIRSFASAYNSKYKSLDLLINNAGVMMPPYQQTEDGLESQMAANYFGHFLLTSLLLPTLESTPESRIVALSSLAHAWGDIDFEDINSAKNYNARKVYGQSKLACLMFAYELSRQLKAKNYQVSSLAAHPGVTITEIGRNLHPLLVRLGHIVSPFVFQKPNEGAWPILRAALDPKAKSGEYFGPGGFRQYKGPAVKVGSDRNSRNEQKARRLWNLTEKLMEINFFPT